MKKFILIIAIFPFLFSCDNKKAEIERLKQMNDSLSILTGKQDKAVIQYVQAFNEIQANLDTIKEKEKIITLNTSNTNELSPDMKERIEQDIQTIYKLMLENRRKSDDLRRQLKKSQSRNTELEKLVERLNKDIALRDEEISKLKLQLASLNIIVDNLTARIDTMALELEDKKTIIEDQTQRLNTAYYVFGTEKELKAQSILTKEGGFIGIGKNPKLMEDFNDKYFTKIDITKTARIPIKAKKAKIITTHPSGSYKLEGVNQVDNISITDPSRFWSVSKYLVIIVE